MLLNVWCNLLGMKGNIKMFFPPLLLASSGVQQRVCH